MKEKKEIRDFDYNKPLIAEGNGRWLKKVKSYSYISQCIPGLQLFHPHNVVEDGAIQNQLNSSVIDMLTIAFNEDGKYKFNAKNTIFFKTADSSRYFAATDPNDYDSWLEQHCYIYHQLLPEKKRKDFFKIMQEDIIRYFDLK